MEEKMLFRVENKQAILQVYKDFCKIEYKKDWWSLLCSGKFFSGLKTIYYREVSAIQFRKVGWIFAGFIKFEYPGAPVFSHFYNLFSDSAMTFTREQSEQMELVYSYIQKRIAAIKSGDSETAEDEAEYERIIEKFQVIEKKRLDREAEIAAKKAAEGNVCAEEKKHNKKIFIISVIGLGVIVIPISILLGIFATVLLSTIVVGLIMWIILILNLLLVAGAVVVNYPLLINGLKNPNKITKKKK